VALPGSVRSGLELILVLELDAASGLIPVVHEALPPAIFSPPPFQQKPIDPRSSHADLAAFGIRWDVLREAVETFSQAG
jgi:hypothetical protein